MDQMVVRYVDQRKECRCGLCRQTVSLGLGPQLYQPVTGAPICRECGQKTAASLVALLDLACLACQVGRISLHSPWVPLKNLLDLAEVAKKYFFTINPGDSGG